MTNLCFMMLGILSMNDIGDHPLMLFSFNVVLFM